MEAAPPRGRPELVTGSIPVPRTDIAAGQSMFLRREFRRVHMTSTTPLLITLVAGFTPLLITLVEGFAHQYVHIVPALAPLTFAPEGLKKNQTCSGWPEHD